MSTTCFLAFGAHRLIAWYFGSRLSPPQEVVKGPAYVAGNSIGGFMCANLAVRFSSNHTTHLRDHVVTACAAELQALCGSATQT